MNNVKTSVEYKITINGNSMSLDETKFLLLDYINEYGAISKTAESLGISYRTALNYISRIENTLDIAVVETKKGGTGGGGGTKLTTEGLSILKECKKINAIMELHKETNELEAELVDIDKARGVMKIQIKDMIITISYNPNYEIGDKLIALISYDNIFLMKHPQKSSIRNVFKGQVSELRLVDETIRVKVDVNGVKFYSDVTFSTSNELDLSIGQDIYIGFKALAIATLKI